MQTLLYQPPRSTEAKALSISRIESWLKAFSNKGNAANVIFLGGEPTLHPDLPQAIKIARKLGYGSVTVDTNGYLFNDVLDKVAPEEVDYFQFQPGRPGPCDQRSHPGQGLL